METPELDDRSRLRRVAVLAFALILFGGAALPFDLAVARTFLADEIGLKPLFRLPGDLRDGIYLCEAFAHMITVGLILLTVYVLDPGRRRRFPRMVACVLAAGLAADVIKMLVARTRPNTFFKLDLDFLQVTVWDTFGQLLPLGAGGSGQQSFPSAHSAVAAGLAVALAWQYPRGRWLFATFAFLAGCQRVVSGAHFVSDACWGLAVGLIVASVLVYTTGANHLFARIEGERGPSGP
jgi:membrane-associated phospholipid phosphatase